MQSDFNGSITRIGRQRRHGRSNSVRRGRERRREDPWRESPRGNETRQVVGRPYAATSMHLNWLRPHSSCSGSLPPLIPPRGKWYRPFCISLRPERYTWRSFLLVPSFNETAVPRPATPCRNEESVDWWRALRYLLLLLFPTSLDSQSEQRKSTRHLSRRGAIIR